MKRQGLDATIPTRTFVSRVAKRYKQSGNIFHEDGKEEAEQESNYTGRGNRHLYMTQEAETKEGEKSASEEQSEYGAESESQSDEDSEDAEFEVAHLNHGNFNPSLRCWMKFMKFELAEDLPVTSIYEGLASAISAKSVLSGGRIISGRRVKVACGNIDSDNIDSNGAMSLSEMQTVLSSFSKSTGLTVLTVLLSGESKTSKVSQLARTHKEKVDMVDWNLGWNRFFPKEIPWILLIATTASIGADSEIRSFYSARHMNPREFAASHITAGDNPCFLQLLGALGYYEPLLLCTTDYVLHSDQNSEIDETFPAKVVCGRYHHDCVEKVMNLQRRILRFGCYEIIQISEKMHKLYYKRKDVRGRHQQGFRTIVEMAFFCWQNFGSKWESYLDTGRIFGKTAIKMPIIDRVLLRRRDIILMTAKLDISNGIWTAKDKQQRIIAMNTCKNTMAFLLSYAFDDNWRIAIQLSIPAEVLKRMRDEIDVHANESIGMYCHRKEPSGKIVAADAEALFQVVWDRFGAGWSYSVGLTTTKKIHRSQPNTIRIGIPAKELQLMKSMILFQSHSVARDKVCARIDGRITFVGATELEVCGKIWRELGTTWSEVIGLKTTKSRRAGKKKYIYIVEEIPDSN